jgi:hypothetical protein
MIVFIFLKTSSIGPPPLLPNFVYSLDSLRFPHVCQFGSVVEHSCPAGPKSPLTSFFPNFSCKTARESTIVETLSGPIIVFH